MKLLSRQTLAKSDAAEIVWDLFSLQSSPGQEVVFGAGKGPGLSTLGQYGFL